MADLDKALELVLGRAHKDPELAAALRTLLEGVLTCLPEPEPVAPELVAVALTPTEPALRTEEVSTGGPVFVEWLELSGVAQHLRLKAGACRWLAEHGYTDDAAALTERFVLLGEARKTDVYLWMFDRNRVNPDADAALETLAELFELTAQVLDVWQDAGDTPEEGSADNLLADVQAALRAAAWGLAGCSDPDQHALYQALKLSAQASGSYLPQLSLGYKPPSPAELTERLAALGAARRASEVRAQLLKKLCGKARYHIGLVAKNPADKAQWRKVDKAVQELLGRGEAVLNLLEPLYGVPVPPELPQLADVFMAALAAPSARKIRIAASATPAPQWGEAVTQVRPLLAGREVLLVGGDERKEAAQELGAAFGCRVRWLETAPHTSLALLEPAITGDVAAVLLIRWSSHVYGELAHVCRERGVAFVRLAGGYNPNRVAHDVLEQAAGRFGFAGEPRQMVNGVARL